MWNYVLHKINYYKTEVNKHTNMHLKKLRKHLPLSVLKANNDLITNLNFSWLPATNLQK